MRPSRKRKLLFWSLIAAMLMGLAAYLEYHFSFRSAFYPVTADPYVPCPAGTNPKPDQRHICVPD